VLFNPTSQDTLVDAEILGDLADGPVAALRQANRLLLELPGKLPSFTTHGTPPAPIIRAFRCVHQTGGGSECFDPAQIAKLGFEAFWNRIALPGWGKRQLARVQAVWEGAKASIGCALDPAVRWEAPKLVERLEGLRKELGEVEQRMTEAARGLPGYRSVISVPGIGPAVAAMLLAAIGDPHRFTHPRQVLRLAGLDLCASKSGKASERVVPRISKQGKPMLRFGLIQAARVAARASEPMRAYFAKLLEARQQERGIRLKRTVKLAAKLLVIAWTLMRNGDTFDPGRLPA